MTEANEIFSQLTAIDIGHGLASSMAAKVMVELGVRVVRFEPPSGDPFDAIYPAHRVWQTGKDISSQGCDSKQFADALAAADICLMGGEDFPGMEKAPEADALLRRNSRLVISKILDAPAHLQPSRPAADILAQARSGIMFEELAERPVFSPLPYPSYAAAFQLLTATFAALYERETTGRGQIVSTSLFEGALTFATPLWFSSSRPSPTFDLIPPKSPRQMIFRCADGQYIQLVLGVPGAKLKLYTIFGLDTSGIDPLDRGVGGSDPTKFYGDVSLFAPHFLKRNSADILAALTETGLPNVEVLPPGGCWSDPQVEALDVLRRTPNGERYPGLPFTMSLTGTGAQKPRVHAEATGHKPFDGVRVLDLGAWVAGPFASVPLADLGAEVIKVEPMEGDPHRFVHRSFASCNRGKKSIALDLKLPEGMEILKKLIVNSDILQHNFRPGVSKRLGIDPAALHAINPDLVVLESSAYGQTGPRAQRPGFDQIFQAFSGHELRATAPGMPPFWSRLNLVDVITSLASAAASAAALWLHRRSGQAATIQTSLLQSSLFMMSELVQLADGSFLQLPGIDQDQTGLHPAERIYATKDGWIAVAARSSAMAIRFCEALGIAGTFNVNWRQWGAAEGAEIAARIVSWRAEDILLALQSADVWAQRCNPNGAEVLLDPAMRANGSVGCSEHPKYGEVWQIGALARLQGRPVVAGFDCPLLGGDSDAILRSLGYQDREIEGLRETSVVR